MAHDPPDRPALTFTPVHVRARWDGWTPDKQIAFVEALSETACVEEACRIVGMSPVSAYALRRRQPAHHFREAWDAALDMGVHRLEQAALGRALNGVARPLFYKGEQVGEWREFDERLTMFLLRYRRPRRYGAMLDHPPPLDHSAAADPETARDDPATSLDWHCDEIAQLDDLAWTDDPPRDASSGDADGELPRA